MLEWPALFLCDSEPDYHLNRVSSNYWKEVSGVQQRDKHNLVFSTIISTDLFMHAVSEEPSQKSFMYKAVNSELNLFILSFNHS